MCLCLVWSGFMETLTLLWSLLCDFPPGFWNQNTYFILVLWSKTTSFANFQISIRLWHHGYLSPADPEAPEVCGAPCGGPGDMPPFVHWTEEAQAQFTASDGQHVLCGTPWGWKELLLGWQRRPICPEWWRAVLGCWDWQLGGRLWKSRNIQSLYKRRKLPRLD